MLSTFSDSHILPDRIILYAQKGWGKTSFAAFAPDPIILMSHNETGYLTLRQNKLVPDAPFAIIQTWGELESQLRELIVKGAGGKKTLVLDALGGFERLCHEKVCNEKYQGEWGEKGFTGYMRGYAVSVPEFDRMLSILDEVREKLKLRIIILAHARVKDMPNPVGPDFKQYIADCHDKTWECFKRWADMVLFGMHRTVTTKIDGDTKGVGGDERVLYCCHSAAIEAGNRHGLPKEIKMPTKPADMWKAIGDKLTVPTVPASLPDRDTWVKEKVDAAAHDAPGKKDGVVHMLRPMASYDALRMELDLLIAYHKIPAETSAKWPAAFKVESMEKLTDEHITKLLASIKKKYQPKETTAA